MTRLREKTDIIISEIEKTENCVHALGSYAQAASKDEDQGYGIKMLLEPQLEKLWDIVGGSSRAMITEINTISESIKFNNNKIFEEVDNAMLLLSSIKSFCNMHDATTAVAIEARSLAGAHMLIESQVEKIERSLEKISAYQKNIAGILRPESDGDVTYPKVSK